MATHKNSNPIVLGYGRDGWSVVWTVVVIVGVICLSYLGTMTVPMLFDDAVAITNNPSIRGPWELAKLISPPVDSTTAGRPLLNLTFAINYAISGVEPWSYHVINLAIHSMAALVLFGVVRRTLLTPLLRARWERSSYWFAGLVALIWAVHPVQTQSVTYISQRAESLMGLFYLATLYCFIRGIECRARLWHSLAVAACLLGTLTKEVIVTAPLMVLLYDRTFAAGSMAAAVRRRKLFYSVLGATWIVLGWLLLDVRRRGVGFSLGVSAWDYALTQCEAVCIYLRLCLWPHPLIFDRDTALITSVGDVLPQAVLLAVGLATTIWAALRRPVLGFILLWFFILLAPTSSVVPVIGAPVAENRLYLPLVAAVVLILLALHVCFRARLAQAVALILVLIAICGTVVRNQAYQSVFGIWSDTLSKQPKNSRAHNYIALLLAALPDRKAEALYHFEEALRLRPDYAEAHSNLAVLLASIPNRQFEAVAHLEESLRHRPNHAVVHRNLGVMLATIPGREADALVHFAEAIRIMPDFAEAHQSFAHQLRKLPGRQLDALTHYREAARLLPNHPVVQFNYARQLEITGGAKSEVAALYAKVLALDPNLAAAREALERLRQ